MIDLVPHVAFDGVRFGDLPAVEVGGERGDFGGAGEVVFLHAFDPLFVPVEGAKIGGEGVFYGFDAGFIDVAGVGHVGGGILAGRVADGHDHAAGVLEVVVEGEGGDGVGGVRDGDGVGAFQCRFVEFWDFFTPVGAESIDGAGAVEILGAEFLRVGVTAGICNTTGKSGAVAAGAVREDTGVYRGVPCGQERSRGIDRRPEG